MAKNGCKTDRSHQKLTDVVDSNKEISFFQGVNMMFYNKRSGKTKGRALTQLLRLASFLIRTRSQPVGRRCGMASVVALG